MNDRAHVCKYLATQAEAIGKLSPLAYRRMTGESVHQLRVAIRRTRATLWVLRHSSARLKLNTLDSDLKNVGRHLGKVRELDVAIKDAKRMNIDTADLRTRRKKAKSKLHPVLNEENRKKLDKRLRSAAKIVESSCPIELELAQRHIHRLLKNINRQKVFKPSGLHPLRIIMKKIRYGLEAMGHPVDPIKRLVAILGRIHDLEFLQSQVAKNSKIRNARHKLRQKALPLIELALLFSIGQLRGITPNPPRSIPSKVTHETFY